MSLNVKQTSSYNLDWIEEAPLDGKSYVRENGEWSEQVDSDTVFPEAPVDGKLYLRQNGQWVERRDCVWRIPDYSNRIQTYTEQNADIMSFSLTASENGFAHFYVSSPFGQPHAIYKILINNSLVAYTAPHTSTLNNGGFGYTLGPYPIAKNDVLTITRVQGPAYSANRIDVFGIRKVEIS